VWGEDFLLIVNKLVDLVSILVLYFELIKWKTIITAPKYPSNEMINKVSILIS